MKVRMNTQREDMAEANAAGQAAWDKAIAAGGTKGFAAGQSRAAQARVYAEQARRLEQRMDRDGTGTVYVSAAGEKVYED